MVITVLVDDRLQRLTFEVARHVAQGEPAQVGVVIEGRAGDVRGEEDVGQAAQRRVRRQGFFGVYVQAEGCLLYTSPSPRDCS